MEFKSIQNLEPTGLKQIPVTDISEFLSGLISSVRSGLRVVQFFGLQRKHDVRLIAVLAEDSASRLHLASAYLRSGGEYPSLTKEIPALHLFERELAESFGIYPSGHPWLKPVRTEVPRSEYPFFHMKGDTIHEVGVGPVHAGIIEPGHFRFSCHGEVVDHLEIALGYQHRGVERLFLKKQNHAGTLLRLAESIAGDTVIGHAGAYVHAMEALKSISVTPRTAKIRAIALELERIGNHLGDLSALAGDVAFLTGSAVFGAMRTMVINTSLALSGSRFGRGLLKTGGIHFELTEALIRQMTETLRQVSERVELASEVLFNTSSVMARFEKTCLLPKETAVSIGLTGPAARAGGLSLDVRADHPFGAYKSFPVHTLSLNSGDVFARAFIRSAEIMQSLRIIRNLLEHLDAGRSDPEAGPVKADALVVSMTEGWRGEIVHVAVTGRHGNLVLYKIKDPSFHNWFGLALAMRENGISDFPLCNKSFNLSYCGFDL